MIVRRGQSLGNRFLFTFLLTYVAVARCSLHLAASKGLLDIVDQFLNVPVDCSVRDSHGTSAIVSPFHLLSSLSQWILGPSPLSSANRGLSIDFRFVFLRCCNVPGGPKSDTFRTM